MINQSEKAKKCFLSDSKSNSTFKDIKIEFLGGEHSAIYSDKIVQNTLLMSESLCSGDTLKFGLCEDNYFSCTVECEENIKGAKIQVFVYNPFESAEVSLGVFKIKTCKLIAGTNLRQIEAYSDNLADIKELPSFERWFYTQGLVLKKTSENCFIPYSSLIMQLTEPNLSDWELDNTSIYKAEYTLWHGSRRIDITFRYKSIYVTGHHIMAQKHPNYETDAAEYESYFRAEENHLKAKTHVSVSIYKDGSSKGISKTYYCKEFDEVISGEHKTSLMGDFYCGIHFFVPIEAEIHDWWEEGTIKTLHFCSGVYKKRDGTYNVSSEPSLSIALDQKTTIKNLGTTVYMASDEVINSYSSADFVSSILELRGKFGRINRNNYFEEVSLRSGFDIFPSTEKYPDFYYAASSNNPYPSTNQGDYMPIGVEMYSDAEFEEFKTHKYGYVRATYLASDNENYSITVECNPEYDNVYMLTDNYILQNTVFTADEIRNLVLNSFYPLIEDIEYTPFSVTSKGIPYLEVGDAISLYDVMGRGIDSYVLQRSYSGEAGAMDTLEAQGVERLEDADVYIGEEFEE